MPITHLIPFHNFGDAVLLTLRVIPHADAYGSPAFESNENADILFQRKRLLSLGIKKARFRAFCFSLEEAILLVLATNVGIYPAQILTIPVCVEPTVLSGNELDTGFLRLIYRVAVDRLIQEYAFRSVQNNRI